MSSLYDRVDVSTKYGKLALFITDGSHIMATTNPSGGKEEDILYWTIRGKLYRCITAHLHKWSDGKFHLAEEAHKGNAGLQRYNGLFFTEGTEFAKKEAHAEIERVVNESLDSLASNLKDAERAAIHAEIESLKEKRAEHTRAVTVCTDKISELLDRLSAV